MPVQVLVEFEQMCGERAVGLMTEKWNKYSPRVLAQESEVDTSTIDESMNYKALDILDRRLRPYGSGRRHSHFMRYCDA